MFEYLWAEVAIGSGPDNELSRLGADGWEAVGLSVTGEHFGETYVRVLLKRSVTQPAVVNVAAYEQRGVVPASTPAS